ncbi:hypothetical protein [Ancylomarina sp.]|uniref:hypothetical protein n=1 Tax=Ancylomarina sp. TaxID=1970196 RepID=UPI0035698739
MDEFRLKLIEKTITFISREVETNQEKRSIDSFVQFAGDLLDADCVFVDTYSEANPNAVERIACYYQGGNKPDLGNTDVENLFPHDNRLKSSEAENCISIPLIRANGDSLGFIGIIYKSLRVDERTVELVLQIIATKAAQIIETAFLESHLIKRELEGDQIKRNEERLSFAFEGARDGIWDWNAHTNRVF